MGGIYYHDDSVNTVLKKNVIWAVNLKQDHWCAGNVLHLDVHFLSRWQSSFGIMWNMKQATIHLAPFLNLLKNIYCVYVKYLMKLAAVVIIKSIMLI